MARGVARQRVRCTWRGPELGAGESCPCIDWSQSGPATSRQPAAGTGRGKILVPQIDPSVPQPVFTIMEKAPTRAFSWLKAPTSAFTFKTLLRHYAKLTRRFQPGEGPSRGLLRDCDNRLWNRWSTTHSDRITTQNRTILVEGT